jgi:hypothetical protein
MLLLLLTGHVHWRQLLLVLLPHLCHKLLLLLLLWLLLE